MTVIRVPVAVSGLALPLAGRVRRLSERRPDRGEDTEDDECRHPTRDRSPLRKPLPPQSLHHIRLLGLFRGQR